MNKMRELLTNFATRADEDPRLRITYNDFEERLDKVIISLHQAVKESMSIDDICSILLMHGFWIYEREKSERIAQATNQKRLERIDKLFEK